MHHYLISKTPQPPVGRRSKVNEDCKHWGDDSTIHPGLLSHERAPRAAAGARQDLMCFSEASAKAEAWTDCDNDITLFIHYALV